MLEKNYKNIVLTGAGQNFGLFLSKNLIKDKNLRTILLTRNPQQLKKKLQGYPLIYQSKIADHKNSKKLFEKIIKKYGEIDVLINNACQNTIRGFKDFVKNSNEEMTKNFFIINTIGALNLIKYTLKAGKKKKLIINILAGRALSGHKRHVEYYSSKAALYNATLTLSNDYKEHTFINIMMGKIDLNNSKKLEKIWKFLHQSFYKTKKNYYEVYCFYSLIKYLKHLFGFYVKNFLFTKRI